MARSIYCTSPLDTIRGMEDKSGGAAVVVIVGVLVVLVLVVLACAGLFLFRGGGPIPIY